MNKNMLLPGSYQDKTLVLFLNNIWKGTYGRECPKEKIPEMVHVETHNMGAFRDPIDLKFKSI